VIGESAPKRIERAVNRARFWNSLMFVRYFPIMLSTMVECVFLLKFHQQIKRTRPEIFSFLEKAIAKQASASGAKVRQEQRFMVASFSENSLAITLDLLLLVEKIRSTTASVSAHIYGWTAAIFRGSAGDDLPMLFRSFPVYVKDSSDGENSLSGIWCHTSLRKELEQFLQFGKVLHFEQGDPSLSAEGFAQIESIRQIKKQSIHFPLRKKIIPLLEEKKYENCLIVAPPFSGKSDSVEFFAGLLQNDFPPLIIRFGEETAGLGCFPASLNNKVQNLLSDHVSAEKMRDLLSLCAVMNRQFLRRQTSPYLFENAQVFFTTLLAAYYKAANNLEKIPVIILEDLHNAEVQAVEIFFSALNTIPEKSSATILGTSVAKKLSDEWPRLFKHIFSIHPSEAVQQFTEIVPELPKPLWEIAYILCLFRKYFPNNELKTLFHEEGKNAMFFERVFFMLEEYGVARSTEEPKILFSNFEKIASDVLGEKSVFIQNIVSNRLCAWVSSGRLKNTFDLMVALHELGKDIDDRLLLDSILNDITSGTFLCIKKNIKNGKFVRICGEDRAVFLRYIFETLKALLFGNEKEVKNVFSAVESKQKNQKSQIPLYLAVEYSIAALYLLGVNDKQAAMEAAKKSVLFSQENPRFELLSRGYRVMALVNLSNGQLSDAMDYIAFATDNAEKNGDYDELALSRYYASGTHFLFGNISKAMRLIDLSTKSASISGRMEWLKRSLFFTGRILFETGNYPEALSLFEDLLIKIDKESETAAYQTICAWIYRCKIYSGGTISAEPIKDNLDFLLFEIEAFYFAGDYENAIKKADVFMENIPGPAFQFIEQPDWSSGFTGIEFILFDKKDFLVRFATAYRSLSLCRIKKQDMTEVIQNMEYLMRNERFTSSDSNDPFFFYAYYCVLAEMDAPEVDKNTAISMAFKRLQSRASRIDDLDTKRNFLNLPFWNKALYQTAKDHKLI
jgi:tetratricopeptide (TPR) repeat protein